MSSMVLEQVKALAASLPADDRTQLTAWLNGELESTAPEPLTESASTAQRQPLTREEARRRLLAAGKLATAPIAPEGAIRSASAEDQRLSIVFSQGPTLQTLIDEDRGPRE